MNCKQRADSKQWNCNKKVADQPTPQRSTVNSRWYLAEQQRGTNLSCFVYLNFIGCCVAWCFIYIDDVVI